jgi:hypothetical protein
MFFHYIPKGKASLDRNLLTGEVVLNKKIGLNFSYPWIQSAGIDLRPTRYCIDCSCSNLICSLVSFDEAGLNYFIKQEGWSYYWLRNRFSFNLGHSNEWRGWYNIMRGYSFDNQKKWEFIKKEINF